ncbi:hypothetical protein [uncultured Fluviicola sp.]|uniref:hypothetical protein n=1 Tax=uncultured Fluviicola sp. TaxID=463303 RepID=UPI0025FD0A9B|nr:hypothetical protein [uncultured Fluviicola sp.]
MKQLLLITLIGSFTSCFAQEKKTFKDYFNEFHISVNHGVPLSANDRAFFGGGLGMSHVFRADRTVGARTGLELECFHVTDYNVVPPESDKARSNQHFYLTSLTIPLDLRINFGEKKNIFLELGGRLGFVVFGYYTADILETGSDNEPYFQHTKTTKAPVGLGTVGLNSGIGTTLSLNEKLDLVIHPDFGANLFFMDTHERIYPYGRLCVGVRLK